MPAHMLLRMAAIVLGVAALVLVGVALMAEPAAPRLVLGLAAGSAVLTLVAMVMAGRGRRLR